MIRDHEEHDHSSRNEIEPTIKTERGEQRDAEDRDFIPVIVKRTDDIRRHPDDVLQYAITEGKEQLDRGSLSLWLSAIAAGLILGFTALAVGVVASFVEAGETNRQLRIATALVYPIGFVICLMSGTQLFTEHTATAVYPILDRQAPLTSLGRLWVLVIAGNVLGALASAGLLTLGDEVVGARSGYVLIAGKMIAPSFSSLFGSAVLAGWLMALGAWLILATPPTVSQIVCIYLVTFLIGLGGLHHSVAGTAELFVGLFHGLDASGTAILKFFAATYTGNLVGGALFVAVLNYAHIRQTQPAHEG